MQNQILGNDYIKRRVAAKDFFSAPNREFLVKNKISYLYLPKVYGLTLPKEQLKIEEIMSNNEVIIYKVL